MLAPLRSIALSAFLAALISPAFAADETSPAGFTLMSYNVWKGWSGVDDGFQKGIASIRESKADVVGLQEATPELAQKIAAALGWHWAEKGQGTAQIVSRYPIVATQGVERLTEATIRLSDNPRRDIVVFNCHLDYLSYGPYAALLPGATPETVLAEEAHSERAAQMKRMLEVMQPFLADSEKVPVFLTGDFNGPSHLDWTEAAREAHGNVGPVAWSPSSQVIAAGLIDSFRAVHPDPVAEPGTTWSAIHKGTEPQDRIDFTYHMGAAVTVASSRTFTSGVQTTLGAWTETHDFAPVHGNTWPSDHFAVLTEYRFAK
ncbi:MAG: exonuclease [Akkermansiaceae bacterium]|nr:exonuclease [Akkermansiaceae bacterium]